MKSHDMGVSRGTHGREPNMDFGQFPPGEVGGEDDRAFFNLGNVNINMESDI